MSTDLSNLLMPQVPDPFGRFDPIRDAPRLADQKYLLRLGGDFVGDFFILRGTTSVHYRWAFQTKLELALEC
jgi:hypothetical protein